MSTILKALEKLEREKESLRVTGPLPVINQSGADRKGPAGWFLKSWLLWGLVGLTIVSLGGTAWYFYRQSRAYSPRLAQRPAATKQQRPARPVADAPSRAATPPIPETARPEPLRVDPMPDNRREPAHPRATSEQGRPRRPGEPSAATTVERPPAQKHSVVQQPKSSARPTRTAESAKPGRASEKNPAPVAASENEDAVPDGSPVLPDKASKTDLPADVYANTPMLTDGRLRVHAIAWSPQPADRMAVINSRVLHEGDSVEDFTVMVIRPDDVVIREKGKGVWRVEFGRP